MKNIIGPTDMTVRIASQFGYDDPRDVTFVPRKRIKSAHCIASSTKFYNIRKKCSLNFNEQRV